MKRYKAQLAGVLLLLILLSTALAAAPAAAQSCDPETDLTGSLTADSTGQITNHSSSCTYQAGIASYKEFDDHIDNQALHDSDVQTIGPNQIVTVGPVDLPNCTWQVDLFYGALLTSFAGGARYSSRLLDARHGGSPLCEPSSPTPPVQGGPPPPPSDGRLNIPSVNVVVYPNASGGLDIYGVDANSNGFLVLSISGAQLLTLPFCPPTNTLIASGTAAGLPIALYRLMSCQYQLNVGPDQEGKVFVYTFGFGPIPTAAATSELTVNGS